MYPSIKKFLEFNGKAIIHQNAGGIYWIAIKPLCEALKVNYIRQFKNLQSDPIFGPELSKQTIQLPGKQGREYTCIPEKYVYGWLLSVQSNSPDLLEYKKQCYDLLFDYFHGTITGRKELLAQRAQEERLLQLHEEELNTMSIRSLTEAREARKRIRLINKRIKQMDDAEVTRQIDLFN